MTYLENFGYQMLVDGEDSDLQNGHNEELDRAGFTQDCPKGDQHCSCAEVCIDYSVGWESDSWANLWCLFNYIND